VNLMRDHALNGQLAIETLVLVMSIALAGCGGTTMKSETFILPSLRDVPETAWQQLSQKRIYFGHQSLGGNIIGGIRKLMMSHPTIKLNIVETEDPGAFAQPVFAHSSIGKNSYPESKVIAFRDLMQSGIGDKADIAFFKFCFWDIRQRTDIQGLFEKYTQTLSALKTAYPKTTFIHVTIPLMSFPNGLKAKIKRALNKPIEWDVDNIKRNDLNHLILKEYGGKEPVFDIAMVESTVPDNTRIAFAGNGENYYVLASEYTYDGGHLNDEGSRRVAEQLLIMLTRMTRSS
jgi:hypothetical protein